VASKIDPKRIAAVFGTSTNVQAIEEKVGAAREKLKQAKEDASAALFALQWDIAGGKSTGNLALDLNIMTQGNAQMDKAYERLAQVLELLRQHPSELVVHKYHSLLGVLPSDPTLICKMPARSGKGKGRELWPMPAEVLVPVSQYTGMGTCEAQIHESDVFNVPANDFKCWSMEQLMTHLIIGDKAVQTWFEQITSTYTFFGVWAASKRLGHPLDVFPALAEEIKNCREKLIVDLIRATDKLNEQANRLKTVRRDPAKARDPELIQTEEGVSFKFREVDEAKAAWTSLRKLVDSANEIDMSDNGTYQAAVDLLQDTERSFA